MTEETFSGRCLCGDVRYTVHQAPLWVGHCHCRSCRRNTGSAVATFVGVPSDSFELTHGVRSSYESSRGVRRSFCGRCGTPLAYESERFPGELHLFLGTLDDPNRFRPEFHVHCSERIPWFEVRDTLPRYPGSTIEADHGRTGS
ncbi:MAG: GFA family protein [Arenicellales bacterium]